MKTTLFIVAAVTLGLLEISFARMTPEAYAACKQMATSHEAMRICEIRDGNEPTPVAIEQKPSEYDCSNSPSRYGFANPSDCLGVSSSKLAERKEKYGQDGSKSYGDACNSSHMIAKGVCTGSQFAQMVTGPLSQMQMAQSTGDYNAACKAAASIARNSMIMNFATGSACLVARQKCTSACTLGNGFNTADPSMIATFQKNKLECDGMMMQALGSLVQGVSAAQSMSQSKLCEKVTANLPGAGGFDCTKEEYKNLPVCDTTPFCSKAENKENPWCVNSKGICEQSQNAGTDFCKCIADAKNCPIPPAPPEWPPIIPPTYTTTGGSDGGSIGGANGGLSGGSGNCEDDLDCGISTASSGSTSGLGVPTITGTGNPDRLLTAKPGSAPNSNGTPGGGGGFGGGGGSGGGSGYAPSASNGKGGGSSDLSTDIIGGAGGGSSDPILSSNEAGGGDGDGLRRGGNGDDKMPKIDLAALLAAGAAKDPKRGLANDPTLLASGITAANGMSNFEKVTRKMNEKRHALMP